MRSWLYSVMGIWASAGALGCAGASAGPDAEPAAAVASDEERTAARRPYKPGEMPLPGLGNERDADVKVAFEKGYLNQNDVNDVIDKHVGMLTACYERAGAARKYAAGAVRLRFLVGDQGTVDDVLVVGSELGNYMVERCLVVEGRKIPFRAPGGQQAADFEYSVEFRSTQQHHVVERPTERLRRTLAARLPSLGRCGSPGEQPVEAVAYITPAGQVVSVGLQSEGRLDIMAAMCVVEQIRRWRLPGDKGHLVRTNFAVSHPRRLTMAGAGSGATDRTRRSRR